MHQLLERVFLPAFRNAVARDAATTRRCSTVAARPRSRSPPTRYVVRPLFFPGGDIGTLAVNGTVNDLAMAGARPARAERRLHPRGRAADGDARARRRLDAGGRARRPGVPIVTGDTKVVDRGKGDGVFINTAGVGVVEHGLDIAPAARPRRAMRSS